MAVTLLCPDLRCRAVLQVPEQARGKKVRCGHCGISFVVPDKKVEQRATVSVEAQDSDDSKDNKKL